MTLKQASKKSLNSIVNFLPIVIGIILLISVLNNFIPKSFYSVIFSKNIILDSIIGTGLGSILFGNPVSSYILGGEFLKQGISIIAVASFLTAWVTVGLIHLPAEIIILGKKFAISRTIISFIFAILVGIITSFTLWII